jgi:DNA polymerase III delta prime subunit
MFKLAQSTILTGDNIDQLIAHAGELAEQIGGRSIIIEHEKTVDKVKEIRQLYRYSRGIQKTPLVFVVNADSFFITVTNDPWQNAFLKLFEEPNPNIYFILATTTAQKLLPTIKSRGQVIQYGSTATVVERSDWLELTVYDRLKIVAKIKTREEGIELVRAIAATASGDSRFAQALPLISDTLERLVQNGNTRLQLTNLAVNV